MSILYDRYLENHKANVSKGFKWIQDNIPEILEDVDKNVDLEHQICFNHDASKTQPDEYDPYDAYFYGNNQSYEVVQNFNYAWLLHIHRNPHHWQHWVLINDDPNEGEIIMNMPYHYIIEMICDWWSFSWNTGNLEEIFNWYEQHREHMKLSDKTRSTVETILEKIRYKLQGPELLM